MTGVNSIFNFQFNFDRPFKNRPQFSLRRSSNLLVGELRRSISLEGIIAKPFHIRLDGRFDYIT